VQVGDQADPVEGSVDRLAGAEVPHTRTQIEHDRPLSGYVKRHARRVAAAPPDVIAMAGGGSPDSMERDADRSLAPYLRNPTFMSPGE
jgi:hypothetical protein